MRVVIPVKALEAAKARLALVMTTEDRGRLMLAMLHDLLATVTRTPFVDEVLVASNDRRVATLARAFGAEVIDQLPEGEVGPALTVALSRLRPQSGYVMVLPADLPLARRGAVLGVIATHRAAEQPVIVPDRHGNGSNAMILPLPNPVPFSFGQGSLLRHSASLYEAGYTPLRYLCPALGFDLDTPVDLKDLAMDECGPVTRAVLHGSSEVKPIAWVA